MKVSYNLRIDDKTKKELENLAKKLNRSLNNLLNVIIEEFVEKYRYKPYQGNNEVPTILFNKDDWRTYLHREKCKTCPYRNTLECKIYGSNPFNNEPMKCTLDIMERRQIIVEASTEENGKKEK